MMERVFLKDWLEFKPYKKQGITDSFYLEVCNDVKSVLVNNKYSFELEEYFSEEYFTQLACFLTAYLEDIISETNIWKSFVKKHHELYNKYLPFYNLEEYNNDEINVQDVSFLIWYFCNIKQDEKFIAPFALFNIESSGKIMKIFDDAWEFAPENEYLKTFYQIDENEEDFYVARTLISNILFESYLFCPDILDGLAMSEMDLIDENKDDENLLMLLNDNIDNTVHSIRTKLLALQGKEWAFEILDNEHSLKKEFLNLSQKLQGLFLYKGQANDHVFIEHIASGKSFNVIQKSIDFSHSLYEVDTIIFMSIVQWKYEWWFSGISFQYPFNADVVLDEKNSLERRMDVSFLDHKEKETSKLLNIQLNAFKDFNGGSQIAFLPAEDIDEFCEDFMEFYNNSLGLSQEERNDAQQRAKNEGIFGEKERTKMFSEHTVTGLVFFNPKSGIEIIMELNDAFPLANNPFFNVEESVEAIMYLLQSKEVSVELVNYCIDNCKKDLPFFIDGYGSFFLTELDFLLRFWKQDEYFSTPTISYTGQGQ